MITKFIIVINEEEDFYLALCPILGLVEQGCSAEESKNNIIKTIQNWLKEKTADEIEGIINKKIFVDDIDIKIELENKFYMNLKNMKADEVLRRLRRKCDVILNQGESNDRQEVYDIARPIREENGEPKNLTYKLIISLLVSPTMRIRCNVGSMVLIKIKDSLTLGDRFFSKK